MLNYLKLTTLNTDLVLTELPLKPLVNETVRDLAKLFIAKDLTVTVETLPTVVSDSQWLRFIFEQLLTNAIKYTRMGASGFMPRAMPCWWLTPVSVSCQKIYRGFLNKAILDTTVAPIKRQVA